MDTMVVNIPYKKDSAVIAATSRKRPGCTKE